MINEMLLQWVKYVARDYPPEGLHWKQAAVCSTTPSIWQQLRLRCVIIVKPSLRMFIHLTASFTIVELQTSES